MCKGSNDFTVALPKGLREGENKFAISETFISCIEFQTHSPIMKLFKEAL